MSQFKVKGVGSACAGMYCCRCGETGTIPWFGSDLKPCCVMQLETGPVTDTWNTTSAQILPPYRGVAMYVTFPQTPTTLPNFLIAYCAL